MLPGATGGLFRLAIEVGPVAKLLEFAAYPDGDGAGTKERSIDEYFELASLRSEKVVDESNAGLPLISNHEMSFERFMSSSIPPKTHILPPQIHDVWSYLEANLHVRDHVHVLRSR